MTTDAVLNINETTQIYDLQIDSVGDITTDDFFDTSLLYSLFGHRRAASNEVIEPQLRRGWIGNGPDFENGSKIWLLEQARLTKSNLNRLEDEAEKALQWLVDDDLAVSIDKVEASISLGKVILDITIRRSRDRVSRRFFTFWGNTGTR